MAGNRRAPAPETSPSAKARLRRACFFLIAGVVCVLLCAELFSRYAFPRISQIEGRVHADERRVKALRNINDSHPTVLLVGNSLLLRGLDYPKIQTDLAPDAHVIRFVIENTEYIDWYYGLRHIFASGVHPSMVVVCLNLGQTVSPRTLGDYSARHLFGVRELLPVAHDAGMDATRASSLVLAHWSAFYASRATMRNFLLNKTAPGYASAMHSLADSAVPLPPNDQMVSIARPRLRALKELTDKAGVPLMFLIPPSVAGPNDLLASTAGAEKIDYYDPFPTGALPADLFRSDGAHLNEKGAEIFTEAIERGIRERLTTRNAPTVAQSSDAGNPASSN